MDSGLLGEDITLSVAFIDTDGAFYDPDTIQLDVIRNVTSRVYGPFTYENDQVVREAEGRYNYVLPIPNYITPGIYTAKWTSVLDDDISIQYIEFFISEPAPEMSDLLDPPITHGLIRESFRFENLGRGMTDRVFLIGHADGLALNSPTQVVNMKQTINNLMANAESPMMRALLQLYNAGCRDIWLVNAAPMREYIPDTEDRFATREEWGGLNFYQRYFERLTTTYSILRDWDIPEILVPLEAPFYYTDDVDFLGQLAAHCADAFEWSGSPRIGIMGTRISGFSSSDIDAMVSDTRLDNLGDAGKFIILAIGEGTVIMSQMPMGYVASLSTSTAAALATKRMDMGITYSNMSHVAGLVGRDLTKTEIATLARARLNPGIRTQQGKRGVPYQVVLATDNTLSQAGSDYWASAQIRLVCKVMQEIRGLGRVAIGSVAYPVFVHDVKDFLNGLVKTRYIKDYKLDIEKDPADITKVYVDVALTPYIGVRELFFTVEVGPGV